jgi:hypothetical protein
MCISFLFWYYKDILESGQGVIQTGDITSEIISQEKSDATHEVIINFIYKQITYLLLRNFLIHIFNFSSVRT